MVDIYGLFDSSGELRYIGKANEAAKRLASHMRDSRRRDTPLYRWIRKNGRPELRILHTCGANVDWQEIERRFISEARRQGYRLLNVADGGDEPHCPMSVRRENGRKAAVARCSNPQSKKLWEIKRALGESLRRGWCSEETKAKMRYAARKRPDLFGAWANIT